MTPRRTTGVGATSWEGMEPFAVLFSLTIYRSGQVRLTTHNGRRDPALIAATLREIALAVESGALILSEYDDE